MNYAEIKTCDIANGPGVRVSLFVSGCRHHCKGCFNAETWDFSYGNVFDQAVEDSILEALAPDYIKGLTLLGGEPMEPENQKALLPFLKKVKERYPEKDIWCYSGFLFEKDLSGTFYETCKETKEILNLIDVMVDGPFVLEQKNISLRFRGSSNQRIIDVKRSLTANKVILWEEV